MTEGMKCTECGKVVRPVVAVDIDGTLGDYHGHFTRFVEGYTGIQCPPNMWYDGTMGFKVWAQQIWGLTDRGWQDAKLAYRQGGMKRNMPVFGGATELVAGVREAGAEVWLTTTRPYMRLDNVDPDTREWLRRHDIEYDGLLYDENKYPRLAELVDPDRVVAVVDDLPEQVLSAVQTFGVDTAILRRSRYNKPVSGVSQGFERLADIEAEVVARVEGWKS